jgi:hypothetical protein
MEGVELVRLGERLLKSMSDSDIKVTDYKYISLYDKYKEMRKEHYKYWYAIKVLSEEYDISESACCRIVRRLGSNVKM